MGYELSYVDLVKKSIKCLAKYLVDETKTCNSIWDIELNDVDLVKKSSACKSALGTKTCNERWDFDLVEKSNKCLTKCTCSKLTFGNTFAKLSGGYRKRYSKRDNCFAHKSLTFSKSRLSHETLSKFLDKVCKGICEGTYSEVENFGAKL